MLRIIRKIKEKAAGKVNNKYKKQSQKKLYWTIILISAINFLILAGFFVYLYFWVKRH